MGERLRASDAQSKSVKLSAKVKGKQRASERFVDEQHIVQSQSTDSGGPSDQDDDCALGLSTFRRSAKKPDRMVKPAQQPQEHDNSFAGSESCAKPQKKTGSEGVKALLRRMREGLAKKARESSLPPSSSSPAGRKSTPIAVPPPYITSTSSATVKVSSTVLPKRHKRKSSGVETEHTPTKMRRKRRRKDSELASDESDSVPVHINSVMSIQPVAATSQHVYDVRQPTAEMQHGTCAAIQAPKTGHDDPQGASFDEVSASGARAGQAEIFLERDLDRAREKKRKKRNRKKRQKILGADATVKNVGHCLSHSSFGATVIPAQSAVNSALTTARIAKADFMPVEPAQIAASASLKPLTAQLKHLPVPDPMDPAIPILQTGQLFDDTDISQRLKKKERKRKRQEKRILRAGQQEDANAASIQQVPLVPQAPDAPDLPLGNDVHAADSDTSSHSLGEGQVQFTAPVRKKRKIKRVKVKRVKADPLAITEEPSLNQMNKHEEPVPLVSEVSSALQKQTQREVTIHGGISTSQPPIRQQSSPQLDRILSVTTGIGNVSSRQHRLPAIRTLLFDEDSDGDPDINFEHENADHHSSCDDDEYMIAVPDLKISTNTPRSTARASDVEYQPVSEASSRESENDASRPGMVSGRSGTTAKPVTRSLTRIRLSGLEPQEPSPVPSESFSDGDEAMPEAATPNAASFEEDTQISPIAQIPAVNAADSQFEVTHDNSAALQTFDVEYRKNSAINSPTPFAPLGSLGSSAPVQKDQHWHDVYKHKNKELVSLESVAGSVSEKVASGEPLSPIPHTTSASIPTDEVHAAQTKASDVGDVDMLQSRRAAGRSGQRKQSFADYLASALSSEQSDSSSDDEDAGEDGYLQESDEDDTRRKARPRRSIRLQIRQSRSSSPAISDGEPASTSSDILGQPLALQIPSIKATGSGVVTLQIPAEQIAVHESELPESQPDQSTLEAAAVAVLPPGLPENSKRIAGMAGSTNNQIAAEQLQSQAPSSTDTIEDLEAEDLIAVASSSSGRHLDSDKILEDSDDIVDGSDTAEAICPQSLPPVLANDNPHLPGEGQRSMSPKHVPPVGTRAPSDASSISIGERNMTTSRDSIPPSVTDTHSSATSVGENLGNVKIDASLEGINTLAQTQQAMLSNDSQESYRSTSPKRAHGTTHELVRVLSLRRRSTDAQDAQNKLQRPQIASVTETCDTDEPAIAADRGHYSSSPLPRSLHPTQKTMAEFEEPVASAKPFSSAKLPDSGSVETVQESCGAAVDKHVATAIEKRTNQIPPGPASDARFMAPGDLNPEAPENIVSTMAAPSREENIDTSSDDERATSDIADPMLLDNEVNPEAIKITTDPHLLPAESEHVEHMLSTPPPAQPTPCIGFTSQQNEVPSAMSSSRLAYILPSTAVIHGDDESAADSVASSDLDCEFLLTQPIKPSAPLFRPINSDEEGELALVKAESPHSSVFSPNTQQLAWRRMPLQSPLNTRMISEVSNSPPSRPGYVLQASPDMHADFEDDNSVMLRRRIVQHNTSNARSSTIGGPVPVQGAVSSVASVPFPAALPVKVLHAMPVVDPIKPRTRPGALRHKSLSELSSESKERRFRRPSLLAPRPKTGTITRPTAPRQVSNESNDSSEDEDSDEDVPLETLSNKKSDPLAGRKAGQTTRPKVSALASFAKSRK